MEVKTEKTGLNDSKLNIYVDNYLWKTVKTLYFEKKIKRLSKYPDFKKRFTEEEKKKILNVSLWLLSKRSYLKKEWISKMKDRFFTMSLAEEVFEASLSKYFNEEEEICRRIKSLIARGKGKTWIRQKLLPLTTLTQSHFTDLLNQHCNTDNEIEQIRKIESTRNLLEKRGREKTLAFFMRRGYSYATISQALL